MSQTQIYIASRTAPARQLRAGRALMLAGTTLTTDPIAGDFYAYACSVNVSLRL